MVPSMGRTLHKLIKRRIDGDLAPGRYGDGGGLYLDVDTYGRRWMFVFRWKRPGVRGPGKPREMGLGSLSVVSLADARQLAQEARTLLARRIDPIEARRSGSQSEITFGQLADDYVDAMEPQFRNAKHVAQWRSTLSDTYCKRLRSRPVDAVSVDDVLAVLRPIWSTTPETASRLRGRIERVLDSARARGLRSGENPARWRGHLDHLLPRRKGLVRGHHAAMPFADLPSFMSEVRASESMSALALEFTILTAARTGETIGAMWSEIKDDVWIIPAERMKAKREHRVPLTARVVEILATTRQRGSEWCFPGHDRRKPLSNMAMLELVRGLRPGLTVHGFRSTFRDWAGDATGFPRDLVELALAHAIEDRTEAAYRRSDALDRRRKLMEAWARYCLPAVGNVVKLRG